MANKICIISSHSPYGSTHVRDGIETLLVSASYDMDASLLTLGEGVLQLLPGQQPDALPQKNSSAMLQAAELYGVQAIYACREDLEQFGLDENDLLVKVMVVPRAEIAGLLQTFTHILSF